jgi:hypothetical protein
VISSLRHRIQRANSTKDAQRKIKIWSIVQAASLFVQLLKYGGIAAALGAATLLALRKYRNPLCKYKEKNEGNFQGQVPDFRQSHAT